MQFHTKEDIDLSLEQRTEQTTSLTPCTGEMVSLNIRVCRYSNKLALLRNTYHVSSERLLQVGCLQRSAKLKWS